MRATEGLESRPGEAKFGPAEDGFGPQLYRIGPFRAEIGAEYGQNGAPLPQLRRSPRLT